MTNEENTMNTIAANRDDNEGQGVDIMTLDPTHVSFLKNYDYIVINHDWSGAYVAPTWLGLRSLGLVKDH